ncbi:MAG: restriction endonuclease subunit S [Syntrophales bacterium]|nr:restriction endonuclease subunit S [Syntrophales bacterium]
MPESWSVLSFAEFATLHRGYDLPIQDRKKGSVPIVGSNGIVGYHYKAKVKGPGVVTGRSGSIGLSYYVSDDYWPLNTGLYVEDFHGNNPLYVHYFFQSFNFGKYAAGVSVPTLNRNLVHDVSISVPQIHEQQKIAAVLFKIQQAIEIQESMILKMRELKKSTLHHVFTHGLREEKLKETEIGLMPESWDLINIGKYCDVRSSTVSFNELNQGRSDDNDILCYAIKVSDMNLPGNEKYIFTANIETKLSSKLVSEKAIPANSVIFPKRGAAIATNKKRLTTLWSLLDPNLIAITPRARITSEFLYYWFLTFDLASIQDLGPTPQLNKKDVEPISIPCPSDSEQFEISNIFRSIDQKIDLHTAKKSALQDLFKTMLNKLMTGEIRVKDLDIDISEVSA